FQFGDIGRYEPVFGHFCVFGAFVFLGAFCFLGALCILGAFWAAALCTIGLMLCPLAAILRPILAVLLCQTLSSATAAALDCPVPPGRRSLLPPGPHGSIPPPRLESRSKSRHRAAG